MDVEFQRGDIDPVARLPGEMPEANVLTPVRSLNGDGYPQRILMGSEFSAEANDDGTYGTIGGYIEVRQHGGAFKKYAVTTYQSIRKAIGFENDAALESADENGSTLDGTGLKDISFRSPSKRAHERSLRDIDRRIKEYEEMLEVFRAKDPDSCSSLVEDIVQQHIRIAQKLLFVEEGRHRLGNLFLCSGLRERTERNARIDIALIEISQEREGENSLPPQTAWPAPSPTSFACGATLKGIASSETDVVKSSQELLGQGLGYSTEHCIVSGHYTYFRRFKNHYDAGSFGLDSVIGSLGAAWGGPSKCGVSDQSLGYVTNAGDVIRWIKGLGEG